MSKRPSIEDAKRIAQAKNADRCVILFTKPDGAVGYASYGRDRRLCAQAKAMGDAAFDAVMSRWNAIEGAKP